MFDRCRGFNVYWNIPSIICTSKFNISFVRVSAEFGFTQNVGDEFVGDQITIMYNPGLFPRVTNGPNSPPFNTSQLELINGGIPQAGDIELHLDALSQQINKSIPDVSNAGKIITILANFVKKLCYRRNVTLFVPDFVKSFLLRKRAEIHADD